MTNSHFADPAGLKKENVSTAADVAKMVTAAEEYVLITEATNPPEEKTFIRIKAAAT